MTCSYCGSRYGEDEIRCRRCGRKPGDTLSGDFPLTTGNLAPKLQPARVDGPRIVTATAPVEKPSNLSRAVQVPLFRERPASNVVDIETYAPQRPAPSKTPGQRTPGKRAGRISAGQASLEFLPPAPPSPKTLSTTVEAKIYCDAPVAHVLHRAVAAAIDWSMVLLACGLFLLVFRLLGGPIVLSRPNLPMFGGAMAIIAFMYGLTWTLAGTETLGMRATRLRLITFDGFPPEPRHRALRFLGSCLSYCAVLGMLWSLADEESLAWQDHISRTFPTYEDLDNYTFRRV